MFLRGFQGVQTKVKTSLICQLFNDIAVPQRENVGSLFYILLLLIIIIAFMVSTVSSAQTVMCEKLHLTNANSVTWHSVYFIKWV